MKVVDSLLNKSEEMTLKEIERIAADNNLRVFSKVRLSDVIQKQSTFLTQREFDYYTKAHFDFVLTDSLARPVLVVEYDGPSHFDDPKQQERDRIKQELCQRANLELLRIHDKYITKSYRGMTLLRWIIEVMQVERWFYDAQSKCQIPYDEPFEPTLSIGRDPRTGEKFPYWLSGPAIQSFHKLFKTLAPGVPRGWHSVIGYDNEGVGHRLSCLYFENVILHAKTAVRSQSANFPAYDLLNEVNTCALGISLQDFNRGLIFPSSTRDFQEMFEKFCIKYDAKMNGSMGSLPFNVAFSFKDGWDFGR